MKASIVDLRYHMNDLLKALARNQKVIIMYHGKKKGVIVPCDETISTKTKVEDTALFGMYKGSDKTVDEIMKNLRGSRYHDL